MVSRRQFLLGAGAAGLAVSTATVSKVAMAALPEIVSTTSADTQSPLVPSTGRSALQPCCDIERLDSALAHAQWREGVPFGS